MIRPVASGPVETLGVHSYVKLPLPPVVATEAEPSLAKQVAGVEEIAKLTGVTLSIVIEPVP